MDSNALAFRAHAAYISDIKNRNPMAPYHYPVDTDDLDRDLFSHIGHGCLGLVLGNLLAAIILVLVILLFGSCASPHVIPGAATHDTVYLSRIQRDSIFIATVLHDSVVEKQRGDTVFIDRWHTRTLTEYRDRLVRDTLYAVRTDSIPVPYPVEVAVPSPLTRWQQARLHLANAVLIALALAAAVWLIRKRTWWFRLLGRFSK